MSKRAEEAAMKAYPLKDYTKEPNYIHTCDTKMLDEVYRDVFRIGYKQAEKELGWHSVDECLPKIDEEVIVLRDEYGTAPIYNVGVGHIVDRRYAMDFNGWNTPGVKYWMRFPKISEEEL